MDFEIPAYVGHFLDRSVEEYNEDCSNMFDILLENKTLYVDSNGASRVGKGKHITVDQDYLLKWYGYAPPGEDSVEDDLLQQQRVYNEIT